MTPKSQILQYYVVACLVVFLAVLELYYCLRVSAYPTQPTQRLMYSAQPSTLLEGPAFLPPPSLLGLAGHVAMSLSLLILPLYLSIPYSFIFAYVLESLRLCTCSSAIICPASFSFVLLCLDLIIC